MDDSTASTEACFSCGALVPRMNGPVHRYMDSCPGCWHLFNLVIEKEYSNPEYRKNSRLTTDAYAVQHHGKETSLQAARSVNHHLISLCLRFEYGMTVAQCDASFRRLAGNKYSYKWLIPPGSAGIITIADVAPAKTPGQHLNLVEDWAHETWIAWKEHHDIIKSIIKKYLR